LNLIDLKKKIIEKDKHKNIIIGKRDMLMENLTELGYKNLDQSLKALENMKKELTELQLKYDDGLLKFNKKYRHLLT